MISCHDCSSFRKIVGAETPAQLGHQNINSGRTSKSLERSIASKFHLPVKAQQPKKKKFQCISFISSKSHSAIYNDDKVWANLINSPFASKCRRSRQIYVFLNYMKTNRTNRIKLPEHLNEYLAHTLRYFTLLELPWFGWNIFLKWSTASTLLWTWPCCHLNSTADAMQIF